MSDEQSWGEDTVLLGQRRERPTEAIRPPHRSSGPKLRMPSRRTLIEMGAAVMVAAVFLTSAGGEERGTVSATPSTPAPKAKLAAPAPAHRPKPEPKVGGELPPRRAGALEIGLARPAPKGRPHEVPLATPPVASAPVEPGPPEPVYVEPAPAPEPVEVAPPAQEAPPAPPAPTPPSAEFGL